MDEQAQQIFMKRLVENQAELLALVRMLMPADPSDVADVAQDVNCALIARSAEYDPSRPFRPWLFAFARMQVQRHRQIKGRERLVFDDELAAAVAGTYCDVFPGGVASGGTAALLRHLETCRAKLPAKYRDLIEKRYAQNRSLADIARETRVNPHSVSTALGYIRGKLHDCITRLCRLEGGDANPPPPSKGEAEVNRMLDGLSEPAPGDPARLPQLLRDSGLMRYWVIESGMDALLRWEAGMNRVPEARARCRPWARLGLAAAALVLLVGGALWALVLRPAQTAAPAGAAAIKLVQREEPSPVPSAAASAAAAPAPGAESGTAATNAATSKENETVNVKEVAVTAAVAAAAIAPPLAARATDPQQGEIDAGVLVVGAGPVGWVETRECATGDSAGNKTWYFSTVPPAGTIYKFF